MISFLKTILIILLVYYALKFLLRLLSPYLMRFVARKAAERFEGAFGQQPFNKGTSNTEENISFNTSSDQPKTNGKVVGEYVDFEEVD